MFDQRCDPIASAQLSCPAQLSSAAAVNVQHVPGYFRFLTQDQALDQSRNPCASTSRVSARVSFELCCSIFRRVLQPLMQAVSFALCSNRSNNNRRRRERSRARGRLAPNPADARALDAIRNVECIPNRAHVALRVAVPTFRRDRCRSPSPLASRKAQPCRSITIERQRSSSWYAPHLLCRTVQAAS